MRSFTAALAVTAIRIVLVAAAPVSNGHHQPPHTCRQTAVAVLGAGVAGIAAAQTLHNNSIDDFVIIDRNDYIGGRLSHATFGKDANGKPYTVELGANWIQGLGTPDGPENPIWRLAKKWGLKNHYSNYSSILTYDETGPNDFTPLLDEYETAYDDAAAAAGELLLDDLQDTTVRAGLSQAGWRPGLDMKKQAVEYWEWDWETAFPPESSSFLFGIAGSNATFNQWSDENNFSIDQRGYNYWLAMEASEFLSSNDSRLMLSKHVTDVDYDDHGVIVRLESGECIQAQHAISTFSLGVLQHDAVNFTPSFPDWKRTAIDEFEMGIYTKIFYQFNETFWDPDTQYFLYADPIKRGYYPIWQSLSTDGFMPGSNIIFATVTGDESKRLERQDPEVTKEEGLGVLRKMFPGQDIPEPLEFMYPTWEKTNWTYGSYSSWPPGMTLQKHQNLRANVDRLWFAGEGFSAEYFGFLQGAYFEGMDVAGRIAGILKNEAPDSSQDCPVGGPCGLPKHYDVLKSTEPASDFTIENGWPDSMFSTAGLESDS